MLELAESLDVNSLKENLSEFLVQPFGHTEKVNIFDVGFGISQILPVIVADVDSHEGATILVNQPEVHLHPSCQASLANYFVERSASRNFIIETHSEYLINRLRLLIADGKFSAADVALYYIDGEVGKIHEIALKKNGAIGGAPDEFFDTYSQDTFNLAMSKFEVSVRPRPSTKANESEEP